jgi:hypothetical protein
MNEIYKKKRRVSIEKFSREIKLQSAPGKALDCFMFGAKLPEGITSG